MNRLVWLAVASPCLMALACTSGPPPHSASGALSPHEAAGSGERSSRAHDNSPIVEVAIDEAIAKPCGIPDADTHVAVDSAKLGAVDFPVLDAVAACLVGGPLKGRSVKLVGRADPRGDSDYNDALGQRRADAVEHYLGKHRLAQDQTLATSRGALDATGTDEAGWAKDRRVDVVLMR